MRGDLNKTLQNASDEPRDTEFDCFTCYSLQQEPRDLSNRSLRILHEYDIGSVFKKTLVTLGYIAWATQNGTE